MKRLIALMFLVLSCAFAQAADFRMATGTSSSGAVQVKATPSALWHMVSISANGTNPAGNATVSFRLSGETSYGHQVSNGTAGAQSVLFFNNSTTNYMVFTGVGLDSVSVTPDSLNATLVPTVRYMSWP